MTTFDIDTINTIKKEDRAERRAIKNAILNSKVSPTRKQEKYNSEFRPVFTDDLSYLAGGIY